MNYHISDIDLASMASAMHRALGTFFNGLSPDRSYYASFCEALILSFEDLWKLTTQASNRNNIETSELLLCLPPTKVTFKLSERQKSTDGFFWFELPNLLIFDELTNSLTDQDISLIRGVDYQIEPWGDGLRIVFGFDLLARYEESLFSELDDSNNVVDRFIDFWGKNPTDGSGILEKTWGWILGFHEVRTENHRKALFLLRDALTKGYTFERLVLGLGLAFNNPACAVHGEVVKYIVNAEDYRLVITDNSVYSFPSTVTLTVSVDQVLKKCQQLSSAITWFNVNKPGSIDVPGLAVNQLELGPDYHSDIIFPNQLLATTVSTQQNYTKLTIPLSGDPVSVENYWNEVHTRGIASGKTLAQSLDTRPAPEGEPSASDLPTDMNPMLLLLENVLRFNAILFSIDSNQINVHSGYAFLDAMNKFIPGHQALKPILKHRVVGSTYTPAAGGTPQFGLVFAGGTGYYGLGVNTTAGGNPVLEA